MLIHALATQILVSWINIVAGFAVFMGFVVANNTNIEHNWT